MSRPAPPALTVRYDGSARTFAAGNDVVIGRDLRADVRIAHPLISRAHLVLRFDQGRWIAIDNGSLNGMYVNGRRVPTVDIQDGQHINIGNPDGPRLTFEVGQAPGLGGPPPPTDVDAGRRPAQRDLAQPAAATQPPPASRPQPYRPAAAAGVPVGPSSRATRRAPQPATPAPAAAADPCAEPVAAHSRLPQPPVATGSGVGRRRSGPTAAPRSSEGNLATSMLKILRPGRPAEARRRVGQDRPRHRQRHRHPRRAGVAPPRDAGADARGTEIRDNRSINGTFVNGARVESALLHDGDMVTIGNVDLVFRGGTLVRRTETDGGHRAPAAWTCTASRGPSRATRRCWTTSR